MPLESSLLFVMALLFGAMLWKLETDHRREMSSTMRDMLETVKAKSLTEKQAVETSRTQAEIDVEMLRAELRKPQPYAPSHAPAHDEDDSDPEMGHAGAKVIRTADGRTLLPVFPGDFT